MLIDWLPQALKRFCLVGSQSSQRRLERSARVALTFQVESLEDRQLLSAANGYNYNVPAPSVYDNISPVLWSMSGTAGSTNAELNAYSGASGADTTSSLVARDQSGRVGVRITSSNIVGLQPSLQALGFVTTGSRPDLNFVEGFIPQAKLSSLGALGGSGTIGISPLYAALTSAGPTVDQAVTSLNVDRVNYTVPGYDGTGVRIGILSDSFNVGGNANLPAYTNGDLPSSVQILAEGPAGSTNEGRAMAELIHDVAPGASISFATAYGGQAAFAQNIRNLANPALGRSNIIVDDVVYLDEPFFQDGVIAQAVNDVVQYNGVAYFSAAGNMASQSYESITPTFAADALLGAGSYLDYDSSVAVNTRNQITLSAGEYIQLSLQWDDPFYTTNGVDTDLDILLVNSSGQIVASATSNNLATQTPVEILQYSQLFGTSTYDVVIRRESGPTPGRLKWIDFGVHSNSFSFETDGTEPSSTVFGHAAAAGAMAVAAAPYYDPSNVEPFSSVGSTTILFTPTGSLLGVPDVRQTPDITAIDGTNTSFFRGDIFSKGLDAENDKSPNFFGTSAAAPHAAAVAALIKQANPGLSPQQIYDRLTSTATDIGPAGVDNYSGYGLINAYAAIYGGVTPSNINFSDSFENGAVADAWELNSAGGGTIKVGTKNGATDGTTSITLDSAISGADVTSLRTLFAGLYPANSQSPQFYVAPNLQVSATSFIAGSLNEAILHLDLSGAQDDVYLSFSAKQGFDPLISNPQDTVGTSSNLQEPMSPIFIDREGSDGVAFSTDGGTIWYRLMSLTGNQISAAFTNHTINLTQIANDLGIALGTDVLIKFQQFDRLGTYNAVTGNSFFNPPSTSASSNPPSPSNGTLSRTIVTNPITIDNVQVFTNQGPQLGFDSSDLTYGVGTPPVYIDPLATIVDPETPIFDGGTLTVALTTGGVSSDRIEIVNQAAIPNRPPTVNDITTSGNRVSYGGIQIGTFVGGSGTSPLIVMFNQNATVAAVQYLLRDITFRATTGAGSNRTVTVTLDDGAGGGTATDSRVIKVITAPNAAPIITTSTPASLSVSPGSAATPIDGTITVTDSDSPNFSGGVLTVKIASNASESYDLIEIRNQGNGSKQIGFSGSTISYQGVKIGTLSGGTTSRIITLTAAATPEAVQALVRNITFRTISTSAPLGTRAIQFQVSDGDGATSLVFTKLVNVVKKNVAPVISGITTTIPNFRLGSAAVVIEPNASVSDADSANFNGGTLTVRVTTNGTANDRLRVRNQGSGIGQIAVSGGTSVLYGGTLIGTITGGNGTPLVISLNANANAAAVRALTRNITFETSGTIPSLKQRTISFQLSDGQGGVSVAVSKFVKVTKP